MKNFNITEHRDLIILFIVLLLSVFLLTYLIGNTQRIKFIDETFDIAKNISLMMDENDLINMDQTYTEYAGRIDSNDPAQKDISESLGYYLKSRELEVLNHDTSLDSKVESAYNLDKAKLLISQYEKNENYADLVQKLKNVYGG